jgi:hypothetical protein
MNAPCFAFLFAILAFDRSFFARYWLEFALGSDIGERDHAKPPAFRPTTSTPER